MDHRTDEAAYDLARLDRRMFLRLATLATAAVPLWTPQAASADPGPIVKPLPADTFTLHGTNAETRWEALAGTGNLVPIDRFFVRNHTRTPLLSADTWRLQLFGTGLRGAPTAHNPVELTYQDLLDLPARTVTARIECAGNGRSFFTDQQNQTVSGTPWRLGAVGVARWRGVPLATVLERAGLRRSAVDVLPSGLDPDHVTGGVNLGPVRRPLPVRKALEDVLVAYEMALLGEQNTKSAFELPWNGTLAAGRTHQLRGRSWSGTGGVREVEVSTDGGRTWRHAIPHGPAHGWLRWSLPWHPTRPGAHTLRARATDRTGTAQPDVAPFNTQGYLFGAVVDHPVTVI